MRLNYLYLIVFLLVVSCSSNSSPNKERIESKPIGDSVVSESKSSNDISEKQIEIDNKGSEKFMRFFFNFMIDSVFQQERIVYPVIMDSTKIKEPDGWRFLPFYRSSSFIAQLCQDSIDYFWESIIKDSVTLKIISFQSQQIEKYQYRLKQSKWNFIKKSTKPIEESPNYDFLMFLEKFASDSLFQKRHVKFPLKYETMDYEKDFDIKASMQTEKEWKFIKFEDDLEAMLSHNNQIVDEKFKTLLFKGIDNGIKVELYFQRIKSDWFLIKYYDHSM